MHVSTRLMLEYEYISKKDTLAESPKFIFTKRQLLTYSPKFSPSKFTRYTVYGNLQKKTRLKCCVVVALTFFCYVDDLLDVEMRMESDDERLIDVEDRVDGLINLPVEVEGGELKNQVPESTDESISENSIEPLGDGAEDDPVETQNDSESQEGKNEDKYASKVKKKMHLKGPQTI